MRADPLLYNDPALHADILEALRRNSATVLYDAPDGILIRENSYGLLMLSAREETGKRLIDGITDCECMVLRGDALEPYARQKLGFTGENPCWQVLYEKKEPLPVTGTLEIRHPDAADYPQVRQTYHLAGDEELYRDFCGEDFFGAYENGEFVGYIGIHDEGSMGMLEIFPPYRRRGYARELYSFLINRQVKLGRIAYAQVVCSNDASLALQRQLGMTFSRQKVYWMWR